MRIIFFIGISIIGFLTPFWFFVGAVCVYSLIWRGYEMFVLGALIDAQFGFVTASMPYLYTLSVCVILVCAELIKPYLTFYES